jgi:hypothetical protein
MRPIRRRLSTAIHHKKTRRLIVDPTGSAVPAQNRPALQILFPPSYETGTIPAFNFAPESS